MSWQEVLSNEVLDIRDGTHDSPKYLDSGYPLITSKNLKQGIIDFSDVSLISEEDYNNINKRSRVNKGDILYSMIGSIGNYALVNKEPHYAIKNVALFKFIDKRLYNKYFLHLINSFVIERQIKKAMKGGTQKFVSLKILRNLKIPLPPLDQQKKIAAILDAADAYRQKTKALITKYDDLTQSLFLDMFGDPVTNPKGWEIQCLSNVCTLQGGFSFKSKDFVENGVKLVKIGNVHFQNIIWDEVDLLPKEFLVKHSNFSLNEGDILMALTRPIIKSLGTVKAVTVKKSDLPCLLNQRVARFVPNESKIKKRYLLDYIYSNYFKNKIDKYSSTSLQPNVSNKQIEKIEIFVPPLEIQNQFTKRVQAIEAQKAQAQASLAQADHLFNSLLQRAFKGELI